MDSPQVANAGPSGDRKRLHALHRVSGFAFLAGIVSNQILQEVRSFQSRLRCTHTFTTNINVGQELYLLVSGQFLRKLLIRAQEKLRRFCNF